MSIQDLEILHDQLPDVFLIREASTDWNESLTIAPIADVERTTHAKDAGLAQALSPQKMYELFDYYSPAGVCYALKGGT